MKKRGQVTVFVIIGFLILIIIGVIFFIISAKNKVSESEITASSIDEVRRQVNLDVKLCFENIVENGILDGARHGGDVILMNKFSLDNIEDSGALNPCSMTLTATQEIKLVYGPKFNIQSDGTCLLDTKEGPILVDDPSSINQNSHFRFESTVSFPTSGQFETLLMNYIREKLPGCLKSFENYRSKGWKLSSNEGNPINSLDDIKNSIDPDIPVTAEVNTCPLDGNFVATLKIPIKFSRDKFGGEESFILDNQEFVYNVNLKYLFNKADELLKEFIINTPPLFNPSKSIGELPNEGICTSCVDVGSKINNFKNEVEECNGCHLYKATDPNTGAYFFNIKCGEYFMKLEDMERVNGKNIRLTIVEQDVSISVDVDGNPNTITKGSTLNVGGIDITYDGHNNQNNKETLIIGQSTSYLWGYYFGCNPSNMCYIECPSAVPSASRPDLCS